MAFCPICGRELVLRTANRGFRAGSQFWGCSGFPECRFAKNNASEYEPDPDQSRPPEARDLLCSAWLFGLQNLSREVWRTSPFAPIDDQIRYGLMRKYLQYSDYGRGGLFSTWQIRDLFILLNFNDINETIRWLGLQELKFSGTGILHNYMPVDSGFVFTTLPRIFRSVDLHYDNALSKFIATHQKELRNELAPWFRDRRLKEGRRRARARDHEQRMSDQQSGTTVDQLKKKEKATRCIFGAITSSDIKGILALRRKGADLTAKIKDNMTAIEYAQSLGNPKVLDALLQDIDEQS